MDQFTLHELVIEIKKKKMVLFLNLKIFLSAFFFMQFEI